MKSQHGKKVQHSWLVNEVSNQITDFKAQPHQIKENIEKIIEKNIINFSLFFISGRKYVGNNFFYHYFTC